VGGEVSADKALFCAGDGDGDGDGAGIRQDGKGGGVGLCGSRVKGRVEDDPLRVVAAVDIHWEAQKARVKRRRLFSRIPGDSSSAP
jgi:hypothetical protein